MHFPFQNVLFLGPHGKRPSRMLSLGGILDGLRDKHLFNKQVTQCQQYKDKSESNSILLEDVAY